MSEYGSGMYALCIGKCIGHGGVFAFDPDRVPSILIDPQTGDIPDPHTPAARARAVKEPVCPDCAKRANPERAALGYELIYEGDTAAEIGRDDLPWLP